MITPFIEHDCTIHHEGKSFSSGGAVVTENYLIAYPAKGGILNDWHGRQIGTYYVISSRPAVFFGHRSWMADRYFYMRAKVNGIHYSLRGFGTGMIAKGRRLK
jgi:hypothetical protein